MSFQDSYSQAPLTFVDTGGDYGADTQGLDYEYAFSLSQTQTQTQSSQLTQNEPRATGKTDEKCNRQNSSCPNKYKYIYSLLICFVIVILTLPFTLYNYCFHSFSSPLLLYRTKGECISVRRCGGYDTAHS